jgi:hypothetical protein
MKKAIIKAVTFAGILSLLGACSSMTNVPERDTYAMPKWYKKCEQSGTEGWFWWEEEYVYSCGAGVSKFHQGAEEEMYAFAINNFAKRINGVVDSSTVIKIDGDAKQTNTVIKHYVPETRIAQYLEKEVEWYTLGGKHYKFVKFKMPKAIFDELISDAKTKKVS